MWSATLLRESDPHLGGERRQEDRHVQVVHMGPGAYYYFKLQCALTGKPSEAVGYKAAVSSSSAQSHSAPASSAGSSTQPEPTISVALFTSDRQAAPTVAPPGRASLQDALDSTQSSESRQQALVEVETGKSANTAKLRCVPLQMSISSGRRRLIDQLQAWLASITMLVSTCLLGKRRVAVLRCCHGLLALSHVPATSNVSLMHR